MDHEGASVLSITKQQHRRTSSQRSHPQIRSREEKLRAIELWRTGLSKAEVSRVRHIPESTLRGWIRNAVCLELVVVREEDEENMIKSNYQESLNHQLPVRQLPTKMRKMEPKPVSCYKESKENMNINVHNSGVGNELTEKLAIPSPKTQKNTKPHRNRKSKVRASLASELDEYFNPDYFDLHDWLILQQQAIGERIVADYKNKGNRL